MSRAKVKDKALNLSRPLLSLCSWVGVVEDRIVLIGFQRDLIDPQGNIRYFSQKWFTNSDWLTDCQRVLLEESNFSSPKKHTEGWREGDFRLPLISSSKMRQWDGKAFYVENIFDWGYNAGKIMENGKWRWRDWSWWGPYCDVWQVLAGLTPSAWRSFGEDKSSSWEPSRLMR